MAISRLATPYKFENFGAVRWNNRDGTPITTIVVHHAATTNFNAMPDVWATREASAHYGIGNNGEIRAYVDEEKRAWHCGNGNSYSIGIECTNISGEPNWLVSDKTVDALVELIKEIQSRRGKLKILGHRDIPGNNTACPGPSLYPRLQEIRNRVNQSNTNDNNTNNNQNTIKNGETTMQCLYERPINPKTGALEWNGSAWTVMFCNGINTRRVYHPDEVAVIKEIYKKNNGKDIPEFDRKTWNKDAPWYHRLEAMFPVVK